MSIPSGFLVLESGQVFKGSFMGGVDRAGEVVFNTSHSGYEEMATDPSYFSQIIVTTAPMQGNYGENNDWWESAKIFIHGFICLELQNSERDSTWKDKLGRHGVPILTELDTREVTLTLREQGTTWGAIVNATTENEAKEKAIALIESEKNKDSDWVHTTSTNEMYTIGGQSPKGPRVAILDFGSKKNILRELAKRCSELRVFPSRTSEEVIMSWGPDAVMLTNGPGDPADVLEAPKTVRSLIGRLPIFGICMGHQILSLALGAKTYKLKFGHRGSNHPIKDKLLNAVYVTSQNHGYAVDQETLPAGVEVSHWNLNDNTVSGIYDKERKCFGVQFHPESCPGPNDSRKLFDYFVNELI